MNQEDIIRMAREAGGQQDEVDMYFDYEQLERFAALVAEHERQRIIAANAPEIEKINAHIKTLTAAEREKLAAWMIERGYATGHGDSIEDLLKELEWQIRESEREACARECWEFYSIEGIAQKCNAAIRARGD